MMTFKKIVRRSGAWLIGLIKQLVAEKQRVRTIRAARDAARRPRTHRLVVFVSDYPRSREAKLAYGLKNIGWNVVLLHRQKPSFDAYLYFDEVRQYSKPWEALALCTCYSPVAYHIFSNWNYDVAELLIRNKPGKVVLDIYDVLSVFDPVWLKNLKWVNKNAVEQEIYCLQHAGGVCCRSPETQYLKRDLHISISPRRILFLDYCWNELEISPAEHSLDALHVVFCGNINIEKLDDDEWGTFLWVGRALAQRGIHFHLYPAFKNPHGLAFEDAYSEYIDLQHETDGLFQLHEPVPIETLLREMSLYDVGLIAFTPFMPSRDRLIGGQTVGKYRYAVGNKLFDYLDAGLPVMINYTEFMTRIVKHYGCYIDPYYFLYEHSAELPTLEMERLKQQVLRARAMLDVKKHVPRLAEFYMNL